MDTRRLSTAESRLANRYEVLNDGLSSVVVLHKASKQRKLLYKIELTRVPGEERKWALIDYINEYKGLHLLPCMVKLGESFRDANVFYVAQEGVKFVTLRDELAASVNANVALAEESIRAWLCQILLALQALHTRNVVHGAVTLNNVFVVGRNDSVRLGPTNDFLQMHKDPASVTHQISTFRTAKNGSATSRGGGGGVSATSGVGGVSEQFKTAHDSMECLHHLAPEMFNAGGDVENANDVWALGILAYKLAAHVAPFQGHTPVHAVMSIHRSDPDWQLLLDRGYSPEFVDVVREMLTKDPTNRSTCRHLLNMDYFPASMNFE